MPSCLNHNDFVTRTSYVYNLVMILKPYPAVFCNTFAASLKPSGALVVRYTWFKTEVHELLLLLLWLHMQLQRPHGIFSVYDSGAETQACHYLFVRGDYMWCSWQPHVGTAVSFCYLSAFRSWKLQKCWIDLHTNQRPGHNFGFLLNAVTFPVILRSPSL